MQIAIDLPSEFVAFHTVADIRDEVKKNFYRYI